LPRQCSRAIPSCPLIDRRTTGRGLRVEYDSITLEDGADPFALILGKVDSETISAAVKGVPGVKVVGCIPQHFSCMI
jgi:hypothetical protein